MSEYVNTYDLNEPYQVIPMERQAFYDEQIQVYKGTGKPSRSIDIIDVILFNESGEMIIQKRASHKRHNPNLLDKSIGGHVQNGDDPNYTVMVETVQELEVPSLVTRNHTEFMKAYRLLDTYLKNVALIQFVDTKTFNLEKIFDKEAAVISNRIHFYL
jgi:energy-coupling factor transporter ATP-binding protein EcfA2